MAHAVEEGGRALCVTGFHGLGSEVHSCLELSAAWMLLQGIGIKKWAKVRVGIHEITALMYRHAQHDGRTSLR